MFKFIPLKTCDDRKILINTMHIILMFRDDDLTALSLSDHENEVHVKETPEQILNLINR